MIVEVFDDIFITADYGVYIKKCEIMAIADMHIGFEGAAVEDGVYFPRTQKKIIIKRIDNIIRKYAPKEIVVCGDFKHAFHKNLRQEWKEVKEILKFMSDRCRISVVRGNHDNYLRAILGDEIPLHYKMRRCGINFIHGHKIMSLKKGITIIGHEHPSVKIRDDVGAVAKFSAFLVHRDEKIVVVPPMSPLASGNDITSGEFLSPVLNKTKRKDFDVYVIDKNLLIYLGKLYDLSCMQ